MIEGAIEREKVRALNRKGGKDWRSLRTKNMPGELRVKQRKRYIFWNNHTSDGGEWSLSPPSIKPSFHLSTPPSILTSTPCIPSSLSLPLLGSLSSLSRCFITFSRLPLSLPLLHSRAPYLLLKLNTPRARPPFGFPPFSSLSLSEDGGGEQTGGRGAKQKERGE